MTFWPSDLLRVRLTLCTGVVTEAQPDSASEYCVAGTVGAGQVEVVLPSTAGAVGFDGSPPPPTRARLVIELATVPATLTLSVIVTLAPAAIAVLLLQRMLGAVNVQVNPAGDEDALTKLTPAGGTSTTPIVPVVACEPLLVTTSV
jgi:hypothetical protein